jgi:hypothetical protein
MVNVASERLSEGTIPAAVGHGLVIVEENCEETYEGSSMSWSPRTMVDADCIAPVDLNWGYSG